MLCSASWGHRGSHHAGRVSLPGLGHLLFRSTSDTTMRAMDRPAGAVAAVDYVARVKAATDWLPRRKEAQDSRATKNSQTRSIYNKCRVGFEGKRHRHSGSSWLTRPKGSLLGPRSLALLAPHSCDEGATEWFPALRLRCTCAPKAPSLMLRVTIMSRCT